LENEARFISGGCGEKRKGWMKGIFSYKAKMRSCATASTVSATTIFIWKKSPGMNLAWLGQEK